MLNSKLLILAPLALLGACKTTEVRTPEPQVVTVEVPVPVSSPCVPRELPANAPEYVDTDAALRAAQDAAERMQLLFAGRQQRTARLNQLEPVVAGCPRE